MKLRVRDDVPLPTGSRRLSSKWHKHIEELLCGEMIEVVCDSEEERRLSIKSVRSYLERRREFARADGKEDQESFSVRKSDDESSSKYTFGIWRTK